ncbi:MAG: FecR domain-containing protein [Balneolales bacterium]
MNKKLDINTIHRYLSGECTPQERLRVTNWIDADPLNREYFDSIKKVWDVSPLPKLNVDSKKAWLILSRRVGIKPAFSQKTEIFPLEKLKYQGYLKSDIYSNYIRVAAIILVTIITGYLVQYHVNSDQTEQLTAEMKDLVTEHGEQAQVTFSDGTEVILNSASSIQFPDKFYSSKREVYLDGEAYFKVAHNSEQPFVVHTQGADVEVHGTEFNIRGWSQDPNVEVVVREGKVSVNASDTGQEEHKGVILTKGLHTSVRKGQNPLPPQKVDIRNNLLWLSGGLHFDEKPFHQVITDIERRFDVQVSVAPDDLLEIPYTGTFQYAKLDEVLSVITAAMEIEYSRNGPNINFYKQ